MRILKQNGTVFSNNRSHRPAACKRLAPADRAARDGDHAQAPGLQLTQRRQRIWRDRTVGGQCVVDVGEDAFDVLPVIYRPGAEGFHAVQSSSFKPATRSKCLVLRVTTAKSVTNACAAIMVSIWPIDLPFFSRMAAISP